MMNLLTSSTFYTVSISPQFSVETDLGLDSSDLKWKRQTVWHRWRCTFFYWFFLSRKEPIWVGQLMTSIKWADWTLTGILALLILFELASSKRPKWNPGISWHVPTVKSSPCWPPINIWPPRGSPLCLPPLGCKERASEPSTREHSLQVWSEKYIQDPQTDNLVLCKELQVCIRCGLEHGLSL